MSAVPAAALTEASLGFAELLADGDEAWWVEQRPTEGRSLLVSESGRTLGEATDGVGSRVHEYGGVAALVVDGTAYWVDEPTQRIWAQRPDEPGPRALVPDDARRYADLDLDRLRGRLLAVCEDHRGAGPPENLLVAVPVDGGEPVPVARGRDFYANPRTAPDGSQLAFSCWDHPWMPWDAAEVHLAELDASGEVTADRVVAGGGSTSAGAPQWSPDGRLHLIAERDGWWNLHVLGADGELAPLLAEDAEHGVPGLERASYDVDAHRAVVASLSPAGYRLVVVDRADSSARSLDVPLISVDQPRLAGDRVVFLGASAVTAESVWAVDLGGGGLRQVRTAGGGHIDAAELAEPESLVVPARGGGTTYGLYYRPRGGRADDAGRPAPLVVNVHGGPVGRQSRGLRLGGAALSAPVYWTSRGYGFVDVAYRGTLGYGREYREALYGRWGTVDVDDCVDVARHLVERDLADPRRIAIRGGSAGGWTVLCAATGADAGVFAAGTAYFPVSDLVALHHETHKFESTFDAQLVGPYDPDAYRARSPLTHVDRVRMPLLFLQGAEDKVCPPPQSERFVAALRERGRPVDYHCYDGEGHGFDQAAHIVDALEREESFYAEHLRG
ncbi:MAG TPA: prolyl oligopeptidase family serine peptidase [Mycobacteriales bacterium]|nr:prolyl oligopeptidase family serine peptidase [Mycobacteriales bacterium]